MATDELADMIRVCRMAKCYDKTRAQLIIHIAESTRRRLLKSALAQLSIGWTSGRAPPGAMEDELEKWLQGMTLKS